MARTDARLELRKARKATAALELNPLLVVRYVAVLQGTSLPPSLACSPGLVLPSLLQGSSAWNCLNRFIQIAPHSVAGAPSWLGPAFQPRP